MRNVMSIQCKFLANPAFKTKRVSCSAWYCCKNFFSKTYWDIEESWKHVFGPSELLQSYEITCFQLEEANKKYLRDLEVLRRENDDLKSNIKKFKQGQSQEFYVS